MTSRRPHGWNRWAAPVVFLAAATVAILLVASALHGPADTPKTPQTAATTPARTTTTRGRTTTRARTKTTARGSFYTVVAGDTFGTIAAKSGTTVAEIERLNPDVSPTSLHIGEKIRVG